MIMDVYAYATWKENTKKHRKAYITLMVHTKTNKTLRELNTLISQLNHTRAASKDEVIFFRYSNIDTSLLNQPPQLHYTHIHMQNTRTEWSSSVNQPDTKSTSST